MDSNLQSAPFLYTSFDYVAYMQGMYAVSFLDIKVGTLSTGIGVDTVIVDSGTNILLLDSYCTRFHLNY